MEIYFIPIWREYPGLTNYVNALEVMNDLHAEIAEGLSDEIVCMLEHPAVYTGGTSATENSPN